MTRNGALRMAVFLSEFVSQRARDHCRGAEAFDADPDAGKHWLAEHPAPTATLSQVADHIDHLRDVAGIDHVGIGSDFDGGEALPDGLGDVSRFPALLGELLRRGYSDDDVRKAGGWQRASVLRGAETVAARLKAERPASRPRSRSSRSRVAHAGVPVRPIPSSGPAICSEPSTSPWPERSPAVRSRLGRWATPGQTTSSARGTGIATARAVASTTGDRRRPRGRASGSPIASDVRRRRLEAELEVGRSVPPGRDLEGPGAASRRRSHGPPDPPRWLAGSVRHPGPEVRLDGAWRSPRSSASPSSRQNRLQILRMAGQERASGLIRRSDAASSGRARATSVATPAPSEQPTRWAGPASSSSSRATTSAWWANGSVGRRSDSPNPRRSTRIVR